MTIEELKKYNTIIGNDCTDTLLSKSGDYGTEDVLYTFKLMAELTHGTPFAAAYNLLCVKIARISSLTVSDKEPNNESLEDSIKDAINYLVIMYAILKEQSQ